MKKRSKNFLYLNFSIKLLRIYAGGYLIVNGLKIENRIRLNTMQLFSFDDAEITLFSVNHNFSRVTKKKTNHLLVESCSVFQEFESERDVAEFLLPVNRFLCRSFFY